MPTTPLSSVTVAASVTVFDSVKIMGTRLAQTQGGGQGSPVPTARSSTSFLVLELPSALSLPHICSIANLSTRHLTDVLL